MAKKLLTMFSTSSSLDGKSLKNASSNGQIQAEYTTRTIRNSSQNLRERERETGKSRANHVSCCCSLLLATWKVQRVQAV